MSDLFNPNSARTVAEAAARSATSPERVQTKALEGIAKNTKSLNELMRIADAADQRAAIAEAEASAAKKDSKFSKVISIVSVIVSLLALFKEPIINLFQLIFSFLNM